MPARKIDSKKMKKRKAAPEAATENEVNATTNPPAFTEEEADFPRGGASALTPSEEKEARAQAEAEFESESRKGRKKQKQSVFGDDLETVFTGEVPKSVGAFRFKTLSVGMKLLGVILEIGKKDLVVSIPGGLRGFVRAEDASDCISSNDAEEDKEETKMSLNELFHEGQLVSCVVISLENLKEKDSKKKSKRIGLSLKLSCLHNGLTIDSMHEGLVIQSIVTSIEDHGYLLSFGVPGITGFLLLSDEADPQHRLKEGQMVQCLIHSVDKKRGMVMVKANADLVSSSVTKEMEGLTMELLVPGILVNARVRAVLQDGLLLSFLTYFTGTVNLFHLETSLPQPDWQKQYSQNQRLKARVLYVDNLKKTIGLSLNNHLVQNKSPKINVNIGDVFEKAVIQRVDPTVGLLLELPVKELSVAGYVHISDVSDDHVDKLQEKFKVGKFVKGRVIGKRLMDGLATVTLKESKVNQHLFSCMDVQPGMSVNGQITRVESFGAIVKLSDGLTALCPLQHMSEFNRTKPSSKFKAGAKMKFKVLSVDTTKKTVTVTHKKTMLSSKLKPLVTYEDAIEGLVTHGWIAGIEEYGCFVVFYNNVKGLVHRTEMGLGPGLKPDSAFQVGQVVKCRVLRVDPAAQRLSLSFILSPDENIANNSEIQNSIAVGDEVSGLVVNISETTITFDVPLSHGVVMAFMKVEHLSDSPGHVEQLKSVLFPGCKIDRLLVLERDHHRMIVTSKFSLMSAKAIPSDICQLNSQDVIPGYIASITEIGCFVHFLGGLTGLTLKSQLSDAFVHNPSEIFYVGQSVRAQVLEVNLEMKRFTLSLKQSMCYSTDVTLLQGYFLEEEKIYELQAKKSDSLDLDWGEGLEIGKCVEGEIQDIKDYGIIVNLLEHKDIVGFLTHHQLKSKIQVGDRVTARILDVVKSDGIVDLSLLPSHIESATVKKSSSKKSSRKRAHLGLHIQQKVLAVVELIKDEYLVLSLPDHNNAIGFASAHDYNVRVDPHQKYSLHERLEVMVGALPETSGVGRLLLLLTSFSDPTSISGVKRSKRNPAHSRQQFVNGEVISIEPFDMQVRIGADFIGRVHITQVTDSFPSENPLNHYKVGQKINAKMIGKIKHGGDKNKYVDLTLRPSQLGLGHHGDQSGDEPIVHLSSMKVGEIVTAYVKEVHDDWAWLVVAPGVTGRLFVLYSSAEPSELICFKDRFKIGQAVKCKVRRIDSEKQQLDLTQRGNLEQTEALVEDEIKINDILGGRVYKILPGVEGIVVQVGAHQYGRVHITHVSDVWKDNPADDFQVGQFVKCVVLDIKRGRKEEIQIDLSLRESFIAGAADEKSNLGSNKRKKLSGIQVIPNIEDLVVGMEVQGFVKNFIKGCFVALSRHLDARIRLSNLSDSYIEDAKKSFPAGKLVKGWIISVDMATGFVEMSLKDPTKQSVKRPRSLDLSGVHIGDIVSGVVTRVEKFGLFIKFSDTGIVGLCHISKIPTDYIKDLKAIFKVDDKVQAKIIKVNEEKNQVNLSMRETYFRDVDTNVAYSEEDKSPSEKEGEYDAEDSDEEMLNINLKNAINDATKLSLPPMPEVPQSNDNVIPLGVVLQTEETNTLAESNVDKTSDIENQQKLSKREKKRQGEARESAIRAAEQKRLEGDDAPETAEDFEKLVHASPNSSFIWIKYMAFLLSQGDVDKARQIAERALQTINFREEGEKLNVWVALLNLENAYGNSPKEATFGVFQKALQYCDPKKLYIALLGIYERAEQHDMADELLKTMTQKFKTSSKIWLRRIQYLLKQGLSDAAHKTVDRSLLSLPQRKHIKLISQVAISEFKIGSPERARSLFEGILRNYPKRADLWSVYLDQEISLGDQQVTRALFERAISLDLPPKKMKFLFKKYLDYEKSNGSEERAEYVKNKAMQYVETKLS